MYNNSHGYYQDGVHRSAADKPPERQALLLRSGGGRNPEVMPPSHSPRYQDRPLARTAPGTRGQPMSDAEQRQNLLRPAPVKLSPSWEEKNLPSDELNFKNFSLEEAAAVAEGKPPRDRCGLVYLILLIHGIGTLMPWNMFITAKLYFVDYKLQNIEEEDPDAVDYRSNFMHYLGLASQIPNLIFNFINIFIKIGGNLTTRIVISILAEVVIFVLTVVLAMLDTSKWPVIFFFVTMASVVALNMSNGIYQSSVYGMASNLPMKYTNAVVLGSNISGTITSLINILSIGVSPNIRTAAIYYFITALFVLLTCFDTYFALPLLRFYRYYEHQAEKQKTAAQASLTTQTPYWQIFCKTFPQLWNVFFVFFVTLAIFPAVHSDVKRYDPSFVIPEKYYTAITCFLVFNFFAMIGNIFPMFVRVPGPRWLFLPVLLRVLLIPAFVFCNYQPRNITRKLQVFIFNDWAFFGLGVTLGLTSGYFSSLSMMYAPRCVDPQHAPVAGMMAAASLILGIVAGLNFSLLIPMFVENVELPVPNWYEN